MLTRTINDPALMRLLSAMLVFNIAVVLFLVAGDSFSPMESRADGIEPTPSETVLRESDQAFTHVVDNAAESIPPSATTPLERVVSTSVRMESTPSVQSTVDAMPEPLQKTEPATTPSPPDATPVEFFGIQID